MWGTIISFVLGFAAGCGFKEIVIGSKSNKNSKDTPKNSVKFANKSADLKSMVVSTGQTEPQNPEDVNGFNLSLINYLFDEYNVDLVDANSFSNLLRAIENTTYRQTLQLFVDKAKTAEQLYYMLENESSKDVILQLKNTTQRVILPMRIIDKLLSDRNIMLEQGIYSETKMQLLVSYSVTNGLKSFQKSLGNSMSNFVAKYESGDDVESLYMEIYTNIKDTLDYLEN